MHLLRKKMKRNPYKRTNHGSSKLLIPRSLTSYDQHELVISKLKLDGDTTSNMASQFSRNGATIESPPCWPGQLKKTEVLRQHSNNKNAEMKRLKAQKKMSRKDEN